MPQKRKLQKRPNIHLKKFIEGRRPTLIGVKKLMLKIDKMVVEGKNLEEIRKAYGAPPEELVKKGKIPVLFYKGESAFGCYQQSAILHSALKELGISSRLTRQMLGGVPHSTVIFRLNGKLYEADPFFKNRIELVTDSRKNYIKEGIKLKLFKFIKPGHYTYADYKKEKKTGKSL